MPYNQHYERNEQCCRCLNKYERAKFVKNSLCTNIFSAKDGLKVRCVGSWAKEKIVRLEKYFSIFATSMYKKWDNINYIEIASGPGICIDRVSALEIDGTSLSIIKNNAYNYISKCLFIDYEQEVVDILNCRIKNLNKKKAEAIQGDYKDANSITDIICSNTNQKKSLNFVFVDPTDCSFPFSTLKTLVKRLKKVDVLINIATGTDFNRNFKNIIENPQSYKSLKTKYENFLDDYDFFGNELMKIAATDNDRNKEVRRKFLEVYTNKLNSIGLAYTNIKKVKQFYNLLFASSNKIAYELWMKANKIEPDGSRQLFE